MAALEVVALYASGLPCTQNPGARAGSASQRRRPCDARVSRAGPQDPCAVMRWGAAERATSPHLGAGCPCGCAHTVQTRS